MNGVITRSQRARDAAIALLGYKTWEDVTDYRITGAERRRVELFINAFAAFEQAILAEQGDAGRLREALVDLMHAVGGTTGFANAVRIDSGRAYPWPALDIALDQALAALTTPADEWQDIEGAPRDGTWVDLWLDNPAIVAGGQRVTDALWHEGSWRQCTEYCDDDDEEDGYLLVPGYGPTIPVETAICKVTHFRPLPLPPKGTRDGL